MDQFCIVHAPEPSIPEQSQGKKSLGGSKETNETCQAYQCCNTEVPQGHLKNPWNMQTTGVLNNTLKTQTKFE